MAIPYRGSVTADITSKCATDFIHQIEGRLEKLRAQGVDSDILAEETNIILQTDHGSNLAASSMFKAAVIDAGARSKANSQLESMCAQHTRKAPNS